MPSHYTPEDTARFWSQVDTSGDCWVWLASPDSHGYGRFFVKGKRYIAHRFSYQLAYGYIPTGMCVLHRCDNRRCVNPAHLFLGTHKDNSDDKIAKGRGRYAVGDQNGARKYPERLAWGDQNWTRSQPERVLRGELHGMAKLTTEQVRDIRERYRPRSVSYTKLAREFGVTKSMIARIIQGKAWREE